MPEPRYTFTVFTATYNRAHTLERPYGSLQSQTFRDFEWVIVDDGSTDGTADLVSSWQAEAAFPIRYLRQPSNAGKCAAYNVGVQAAQGRFFLSIDSDDELLPHALQVFKDAWESIPDDQKPGFSAVTGLAEYENGELVGTRYPFSPTDSNSLEIRHRYRVQGEKCGFQRTDILRQYPYKIFPGENYIPDSLIYNRIAIKYQTRYINDVVRKFYDTPGGWTRSSVKVRFRNPLSIRYYYRDLIGLPYPFSLRSRLRGYANYVRASLHGKVGLAKQASEAPSLLFWLAALPLGLAVYLRDRRLLADE